MNLRDTPVTGADIATVLDELQVPPDGIVLVHSSLGQIGWCPGGAQLVLQALLAHLEPGGTLVMPGFSSQLSDPAHWSDPPVPAGWVRPVREAMPLFDPARTPTRGVGRLPEALRALPQTRRSAHPVDSFLAYGPAATDICAHQPLDCGLGPAGPLGRMARRDARVLFLGTGWETCTTFHLADYRENATWEDVAHPDRIEHGTTIWRTCRDADHDTESYPAIGVAFEETGQVRVSRHLASRCRAFSMRAAAEFAHRWYNARSPT